MDNIQGKGFLSYYRGFFLSRLPPQWLDTITAHSSTYWQIYQTLLWARNVFLSLFNPLLHRLQTSPDVASFLLLALLLWISYQFLSMARRAFMFWLRTTLQMAFWGAIAAVGMWIWSRGVDGAIEDFNGLATFWAGEYERWKEAGRHGTRGSGSTAYGKGKAGWR